MFNFRKRKTCCIECSWKATGAARRAKVAAEEPAGEVRHCEICGDPIPRKPGEPRWRWVQRQTCGKGICRGSRYIERPPLEEKPCKNCGGTMHRGDMATARFKAREFCCYECSAAYRARALPDSKLCEVCGSVFYREGRTAQGWRNRETCSEECRYILIARSNSETNPALIPPPKTCEQCGRLFYKRREESHISWAVKKVCSRECAAKVISGDRIEVVDRFCRWCGVLIERRPGQGADAYMRRVACGFLCAGKYSAHIRAYGLPASHPYGKAEYKDARDYVLERDGYQCRLCQATGTDVELQAHHISYDPFDNWTGNLITLCKSCHGKTNGGDRAEWQRLFYALIAEREVASA